MAHLVQKMLALDPHDPTGVKTWFVGLEQGQLDVLLHEDGTSRDKVRLKRLVLAKEVVQSPIVVFEGWQRPEHADGLCYCGLPDRDYRGLQIDLPAPPNMVFCVYVKPSGKMTRWDWEPRDACDPAYPEDSRNRFGRVLWPPPQAT